MYHQMVFPYIYTITLYESNGNGNLIIQNTGEQLNK